MTTPGPLCIERQQQYWLCTFTAMASPCELLFDIKTGDKNKIQTLANIAYQEAQRIEHKFSRYRDDNIVYAINHANGTSVKVDDETARLLDYADQLYQLSEGLFDISSGVFRRIWKFDGSDNIPSPALFIETR